MSDPVLDRFWKLARLATNAGATDGEARTAAVMAVKLIVERGLVVSMPARAQAPPPPSLGLYEQVIRQRQWAEQPRTWDEGSAARQPPPFGWWSRYVYDIQSDRYYDPANPSDSFTTKDMHARRGF